MLPNEPRTVKPRKPGRNPWLPIIAVDRESRTLLCESTGSIHGWAEIPDLFQTHEPAVVIAPSASYLLAELNPFYEQYEHWQYRVTPVKQERFHPDPTKRRRATRDTLVNYFGWRGGPSGESKKRGHWFYPVDPNLFSAAPIRELLGGDGPYALLAWGRDLREWCNANNLHPSPTAGGLGGQLLRDPRWYPEPRRKVPKKTNARARSILPGNHYRLYWPENKLVDALYLDMSASHHQIAATLTFPCANTLYARGRFRVTDTTQTTLSRQDFWIRSSTPRFNELLEHAHGLLLVQLNVPVLKQDRFPPPYMESPGRRRVWIYTNELPTIRALGGDIEGIIAAWISYDTETGLNGYAAWALTELATMTDTRKRWAKQVLLSAYGNLAAKSRAVEYAYRGDQTTYPAGPKTLPVKTHVGEVETEPPTVNVIHRGMIEAEQRRIVLDLARELHGWGVTVLAVYADSVIVKADTQLPLLPPPWRIDTPLTRLRFLNPTSFTSDELTKLPGVSREDMERYARKMAIRRRI